MPAKNNNDLKELRLIKDKSMKVILEILNGSNDDLKAKIVTNILEKTLKIIKEQENDSFFMDYT